MDTLGLALNTSALVGASTKMEGNEFVWCCEQDVADRDHSKFIDSFDVLGVTDCLKLQWGGEENFCSHANRGSSDTKVRNKVIVPCLNTTLDLSLMFQLRNMHVVEVMAQGSYSKGNTTVG